MLLNDDPSTIKRRLQIDLITGDFNPIVEWFKDLWDKIIIVETDVYHTMGNEIIYYIIDDKGRKQWVFFRDDKFSRFWCNHKHYWYHFKKILKYKVEVIKDITTILIENSLGEKIPTPRECVNLNLYNIEISLDSIVAIPLTI